MARSARDQQRWDRATARGDKDPWAGWRRDSSDDPAPATQPMGGATPAAAPNMGGRGAAFGGDSTGGPSTAAPIMPPTTTSTTAGAMTGLAGAMGEGGTGIRHGSFVPLRQGIGQRSPAPMEALLRGKMY